MVSAGSEEINGRAVLWRKCSIQRVYQVQRPLGKVRSRGGIKENGGDEGGESKLGDHTMLDLIEHFYSSEE